jgi:hypothetical protein
MATEKITLRIKAETLGTVSEVSAFLRDIEHTYNAIYAFEFIVEMLASERQRAHNRFRERHKYFSEFRIFISMILLQEERQLSQVYSNL